MEWSPRASSCKRVLLMRVFFVFPNARLIFPICATPFSPYIRDVFELSFFCRICLCSAPTNWLEVHLYPRYLYQVPVLYSVLY